MEAALAPAQANPVCLSVVVGCVVAGIGDLSFDGWGYMFAFASVVMQSVYLLLIEFQVRGAEYQVMGAECEEIGCTGCQCVSCCWE